MKTLEEMSASELKKAIDKESAIGSKINREFIDAGRGYEKPSEIRQQKDDLSKRYNEHGDKWQALMNEKNRRERFHGSMQRVPTRHHRFV